MISSNISILFTDFDGVWTDNRVTTDSNGVEYVHCSKYDSLGLSLMSKVGVPVVVISSETSSVVRMRCEKLKLECFTAVDDKTKIVKDVCNRFNIVYEDAGFVGNDLNDLDALELVGFPMCVSDAIMEVKAVSKFVSNYKGGNGALREIFETIYKIKYEKCCSYTG